MVVDGARWIDGWIDRGGFLGMCSAVVGRMWE